MRYPGADAAGDATDAPQRAPAMSEIRRLTARSVYTWRRLVALSLQFDPAALWPGNPFELVLFVRSLLDALKFSLHVEYLGPLVGAWPALRGLEGAIRVSHLVLGLERLCHEERTTHHEQHKRRTHLEEFHPATGCAGHVESEPAPYSALIPCLLYTSDAADEEDSVDLGGRRIIKKKKKGIQAEDDSDIISVDNEKRRSI
eukprot:TRINITY_DN23647_c0_g1_i1.p1 TRINITY_DN23647_c0_g1~~TRINITY_DN23647_c0_g1_i1.p1  ORF type:complete len:201 (-),score=19.71 TRINITY_DN23647_c0_g1_i1:6-608(-)